MGGLRTGGRLSLALLLAACSHPAPPPPPPAPAPPTPAGVYHTVLPGETLWRIARSYGIPLETLVAANAITDVRRVPAGARLFVPGGSTSGGALPGSAEAAHAAREAGLVFGWPVQGRVTSRFGGRRRHDGVDVSAPRGTLIRAAEAGRVVYSGSGLDDYGNLVVIRHSGDYATAYAHNRTNRVKRGDFVARGAVIAEVGTTGNASGPHVHFEVRHRDRPVDPLRYLPRAVVLVEHQPGP